MDAGERMHACHDRLQTLEDLNTYLGRRLAHVAIHNASAVDLALRIADGLGNNPRTRIAPCGDTGGIRR